MSFGQKNVYKFAKQTTDHEAFKNVAALTKGREIELSFMVIFPFVTLATDFFVFFQTSVKGITLNGELSTFYLFLFHLLFFSSSGLIILYAAINVRSVH